MIQTTILEGMAKSTVEYMIAKSPLGRAGTVEAVATLVHDLVSHAASFTTGPSDNVNDGRAT